MEYSGFITKASIAHSYEPCLHNISLNMAHSLMLSAVPVLSYKALKEKWSVFSLSMGYVLKIGLLSSCLALIHLESQTVLVFGGHKGPGILLLRHQIEEWEHECCSEQASRLWSIFRDQHPSFTYSKSHLEVGFGLDYYFKISMSASSNFWDKEREFWVSSAPWLPSFCPSPGSWLSENFHLFFHRAWFLQVWSPQ